MIDVIVLGSLNMDLVVRTEHIPRPGETVRGDQFATIPGGKGANQAAAAARLGARVEMVGRVGADAFGPVLLENMRAQGVGVSHVASDAEAPTGIAMIILDAGGENSIVVAPGANGRVTMADVEAARDLLRGARFLVMQFEIPMNVVREAMRLAHELGLPVILNPAPALPAEPELLRGAEFLVANESEARTLTGVEVANPGDARRAGRALLDVGVPHVILTLGAEGALLCEGGDAVHVPARQVKVVDTTAAGDAFIGGLTVALLNGFTSVEAARYATCAGTLATTVLGAQTSLPSAAEVQAFYEEGPA
jgi:ribokinase